MFMHFECLVFMDRICEFCAEWSGLLSWLPICLEILDFAQALLPAFALDFRPSRTEFLKGFMIIIGEAVA
ncbi:MAG TPA: hypothetical protein VMB21_06270 [Candidatus Limnocylindria bacterium]|jgi:hypothetical protein|nr:hypothetical protein [Candidatus Limnocylindria bacterium]